jgi:hypothetical protein
LFNIIDSVAAVHSEQAEKRNKAYNKELVLLLVKSLKGLVFLIVLTLLLSHFGITSSTFSTFPSFKINRSTNRLLALETSGKAIKFNIMIHKETMIPPISMRKGAILKLISLNADEYAADFIMTKRAIGEYVVYLVQASRDYKTKDEIVADTKQKIKALKQKIKSTPEPVTGESEIYQADFGIGYFYPLVKPVILRHHHFLQFPD